MVGMQMNWTLPSNC